MKPIAIEAAIITEHPNGLATFAVNESLLDPLSASEKESLIKTLLQLSRKSLQEDMEDLSGHETIKQSDDEEHKYCVLQMRLLVTPAGRFTLLTYFGKESEPSTRLHTALTHAMQVVSTCEKQG